jgi:hypothetical protein
MLKSPVSLLVGLAVFAGCENSGSQYKLSSESETVHTIDTSTDRGQSELKSEQEQQTEYPGKTIDQIFPISYKSSLIDEDGREDKQEVAVDDFTVRIRNYVPADLIKNGISIFQFEKREPGGYWGTLVGKSKLLGKSSEQIYTVVSGPGGVCCTNYSIVDVSSRIPRSIFHSEDFGSFRDPMEIFDADDDGVYELTQFDSCFRYFMDDCGSCSPQPRAYFKYNKARMEYLPVAGIVQAFVAEGHQHSGKWLAEKYEEFERTGDLGLDLDIRRAALAHMVDLLYIGEEEKAWTIFDKYVDDPKGETRREIKKRLGKCKFYQMLKKRG